MRLLLIALLFSVACTAQVTYPYSTIDESGKKIVHIEYEYIVQHNVNFGKLKFQCEANTETLQTRISDLSTADSSNRFTIGELRKAISDKDTVISELRKTIASQNASITDCIALTAQYDAAMRKAIKSNTGLKFGIGGTILAGIAYAVFSKVQFH